jgi:hypothetical protein
MASVIEAKGNIRLDMPEGKRSLGRYSSGWECNIKIHPKVLGYGKNWVQLQALVSEKRNR